MHYIGKDHNEIPGRTVNSSAANIHGAVSGLDQIDFHTGVQVFAEKIPIGTVLNCGTRDGVFVKWGAGASVFHLESLLLYGKEGTQGVCSISLIIKLKIQEVNLKYPYYTKKTIKVLNYTRLREKQGL